MATEVRPFLMFQDNNAEEAMNLYVSLFADGKILEVKRYGPGEMGAEGTIMKATFFVGGQTIHCIDSPIRHEFGFTPAMSLFVECESQEQLRKLYEQLSTGGAALMPLGNYGFSRQFGWVNDRFGVSWQLNLR